MKEIEQKDLYAFMYVNDANIAKLMVFFCLIFSDLTMYAYYLKQKGIILLILWLGRLLLEQLISFSFHYEISSKEILGDVLVLNIKLKILGVFGALLSSMVVGIVW